MSGYSEDHAKGEACSEKATRSARIPRHVFIALLLHILTLSFPVAFKDDAAKQA